MTAVLTGEEIKAASVVRNASEDSYRGASYDVRIGQFVARDGDGFVTEQKYHILKPQGVVEVVSIEHLAMPADVTALAVVKTGLCDKGILALNIGIVDPYWSGPVSTTLVNFSKEEYVLNAGDVFLRIMFFHTADTSLTMKSPSAEEYLKSKREKALKFSDTFLNLRQSVERVVGPVFWKYIALAGALLATLTFLVNLGVSIAGRHYWSNDDIKRDILRDLQADQQRTTDVRLIELTKQLGLLRSQLQDLQSKQSSSSDTRATPDPRPRPTPADKRREHP